jgi:hypothetical protein
MLSPLSFPIESVTSDYFRIFSSSQVLASLQLLMGPIVSNMVTIGLAFGCFSSLVGPWGWQRKQIGLTYKAVVQFSFHRPGMY